MQENINIVWIKRDIRSQDHASFFEAEKDSKSIILYSIVDSNLAKYLANTSDDKKIPCFGVLGELILSFSKLLNQKASHEPSGQYALNDDYYKRIEAIQFTMNHDDGNLIKEINKSDIVLLGVSRTSKTPTSIYLANKGLKTSNIPLVNKNSIPNDPESPFVTSGIRIGSPAITSRGFMEKEANLVGNFIADVLDDPDNLDNIKNVKFKVSELTKKFPVYGN